LAEKAKKVKKTENAIQRYFRETRVNFAKSAGPHGPKRAPDWACFGGHGRDGHFPCGVDYLAGDVGSDLSLGFRLN
jgi:hypothetical protein